MGKYDIGGMAEGLRAGSPNRFLAAVKRGISDSSASTLEALEAHYRAELERILEELTSELTQENIEVKQEFGNGRMSVIITVKDGLRYIIVIRLRGIAESALEDAKALAATLTPEGAENKAEGVGNKDITVGVSFSGLDRTIDRWVL